MARSRVDAATMTDVWRHLRARDSRPRPDLPEGRGMLTLAAAAGRTAVLHLYDEIGYWGVSATDFVEALAQLDVSHIDLRINSPGGDVFDGVAIYNALADHPADVTVTVDALAASAASVVAMAGDRIKMNRGAQMMIHDASGLCIGNAADMQKMCDLLHRVSDGIAGTYAARAGGTAPAWRQMMLTETWYSAAEAVAAGLADEMATNGDTTGDTESAAPAARARYDLACFLYAGRACAPAPTPVNRAPAAPAPSASAPPALWDAARFAAQMREALA